MNKKSAILFFSVLFLLSLGALYVFADIVGLTSNNAGDGYEVNGWIRDLYPSQVNLTVNATQLAGDGIWNITNITFGLNEYNVTWDAIVPGTGASVNLSVSADGDGTTTITYHSNGSAWPLWRCLNVTDIAGKIECYITNIDEGGLGGQIGDEDLVLTLNMTAHTTVQEGAINFSVWISNETAANYTETTIYIDTNYPRLIEVNISDGNTTYANGTWNNGSGDVGTGYRYFLNGPITIEALIEDSQLGGAGTEGGVVLGYLCNSSNASVSSESTGGSTERVLGVINSTIGTLNGKGSVTTGSTSINCYTSYLSDSGITGDLGIYGANETFNFVFLVNDTFNHRILLNGTDAADPSGSFWITLDDGEILPTIERVNVTQTTKGTSDGDFSISKTLEDHNGDLNGVNDYLAANIATFEVELKGGDKPDQVYIVWNDTGANTTTFGPAVIGGTGPFFENSINLDRTFVSLLTLNNYSHTFVNSSINDWNTTTVVYRTTLDLTGNNSHDFAFWVYTNNTGNNYTRIAGPYRFYVDGSAPSITMTPPTDLVISPRASITYSCKATDVGSGAYWIMWQLKKPGETAYTEKQGYENVGTDGTDSIEFTGDDTNLAGEYNVKCLAIDNLGNEGTYTSSSSETFSVHYSTTGGAGEGAAAAADIDLSTQEEVTITEKQGVISTFTLDGTTVHTIKIKTVDEVAGTVTIVIESDPIEITLKIGETKEVDIDADGANDISVTLNKITDGAADITTKRLTPLPTEKPTEEVPPTEKPAEEIPTAPEAASKTWLWILIIVIIVVIGVGYWFMKRK